MSLCAVRPYLSIFSAGVQCWRALPVYLLLGLQPEATCQCCSKSIQMLALASLRAALPLCHITTSQCMPCVALAFGIPLLSRQFLALPRRCVWCQQCMVWCEEASLLGIWTASARCVSYHTACVLVPVLAKGFVGWLAANGQPTKKASTARHRGASLIADAAMSFWKPAAEVPRLRY